MRQLMALAMVAMGACGAPRKEVRIWVPTAPETPLVVKRGSAVTRTIRVTAIDSDDGSEVAKVNVKPVCRLMPSTQPQFDAFRDNATCTFSASSIVTPAELTVTVATTDASPVGEHLARLNVSLNSSTDAVASALTGFELTVTE